MCPQSPAQDRWLLVAFGGRGGSGEVPAVGEAGGPCQLGVTAKQEGPSFTEV